MIIPRVLLLAFILAFAISSTGCGFSIWPWGKRENSAVTEPKRETKQEKSARLVRELSDAAVSIRRSDMLELEGAAIVGALGGGPEASARVAGRASSAARSASTIYVAALQKLSKLPPNLVDAQVTGFVYPDQEKTQLLASLKPAIRRHLNETRLGLKPSAEACIQDLQSSRYAQ
jgi:hypothetical protein